MSALTMNLAVYFARAVAGTAITMIAVCWAWKAVDAMTRGGR